MLTLEFDYEKLADALMPKIEQVILEMGVNQSRIQQLPPVLTREQLMELFHIKPTKTAELLGRSDFPVLREAGVLIPADKLLEWIDDNTQWVKSNTSYFKVI